MLYYVTLAAVIATASADTHQHTHYSNPRYHGCMDDEFAWFPDEEHAVCAKHVHGPDAACPTDVPRGSPKDLRPENRNFGPLSSHGFGHEHICVLSCEVDAHCPYGAHCSKPPDGQPYSHGAFCSYHADGIVEASPGVPSGLYTWESHGALPRTHPATQRMVIDDDMIARVNSDPSSTWRAGRNTRFEGAKVADVMKLNGALQTTNPEHVLPFKARPKVALPESFDWRTDARAAKCPSLKEIRDQANCGSCWAFGSVEAMTDRICIASNGTKQAHLSAQDVAACDVLGDMGCNGGIPSTVYTYYQTFGIVTGGNYGDKSGCWSYQLQPCAHHTQSSKYPACGDEVRIGGCKRECTDNGSLKWEADKRRGTGGYSVCQQGMSNGACATEMQQEIFQNGPITGMFFVHQSFTAYKSGVYKHKLLNDPMLGGHAIKIMGWGTENGSDYWLVANSWNDDWGDKGYFKIARGHNECQIENPVINGGPVAGMPKL